MITTRERLSVPELLRGAALAAGTRLDDLLRPFLPLDDHQVVYTSQGKAAFEQIIVAAGLSGSRILLPAFFPDDFVGVFRKHHVTPVFVDVDPATYHLDLRAVTPTQLAGARALVLEHTFGLPADGAAYRSFCDAHGLVLIEDCARALGAASSGRLVGAFGHYAMFSLPKCAPVRAGGIALAERPFTPRLAPPRVGLWGVLHALTLVRYPGTSAIEGMAYRWLADSPVYPREVGNYDPLPGRELDAVGRLMLKAFLPVYADALARKRACAKGLRRALEPLGYRFQADPCGEHIYTSLAVDPPDACSADELKSFLVGHGVKASAMWREALGVSRFGRTTWGADPGSTPVAARLAARLIQLPVSRFRTPAESRRIVTLCGTFTSGTRQPGTGGMRFAAGQH